MILALISNDRLLILFELGEVKAGGTGPIVYNVFLKGPARIIYAGELRSEALLYYPRRTR